MKNTNRLTSFIQYLQNQNLAPNTILAYHTAIKDYLSQYKKISRKNLITYKEFLIRNYKPNSVNLKIHGINSYLKFIHKNKLQLSFLKFQQKTYIDKLISENDYQNFKARLRNDNRIKWYYIIWILAATGMRIGELIKIKIEDLDNNSLEVFSKGGKIRNVYIPENLKINLKEWLNKQNRHTGFLFVNRFGNQLSVKGIEQQLRTYAKDYNINPDLVHPHAFRHFFAKKFLSQNPNIALLADLLGHANISTTRTYLRQTSSEQQEMINKIVQW